MTTLYPWGYGRTLVDMKTLQQKAFIHLMEPEFAKRLFAWVESRNGHIGIGGAVRFIQPVGPTFAPAGMSFHEQQKFGDNTIWFAAVDLVARNGNNVHRAPYWSEVPKQGSGHKDIGDYGVHCNVNGEPWHMQCMEMDGYTTWSKNGRRRPNPNFVVAGKPKPTPTPTPAPTPKPSDEYKLGSRTLKLASPTMRGNDVRWVQQTLRNQGLTISVDSYYGRQTVDRVKSMQGWNGLTKDGIVGPKTWAVLFKY